MQERVQRQFFASDANIYDGRKGEETSGTPKDLARYELAVGVVSHSMGAKWGRFTSV